MKPSVLAVIAARGGSKRIPRKNIRDFLGKPIIAYPIAAALKSGCIDEVMVSTDDADIARVAQAYGAKVPFMRSAGASGDRSTIMDVIREVIREYSLRGMEFEFGCCLFPTAPFVTPELLASAFQKLIDTGADTLLPVTRFSYPIRRSLRIENGRVKMNWPEHAETFSQDLPPDYHDCGQFYFYRTEAILGQGGFLTDRTVAFELPETEVQDIDNEEDWKMAELKFSAFMKKDAR